MFSRSSHPLNAQIPRLAPVTFFLPLHAVASYSDRFFWGGGEGVGGGLNEKTNRDFSARHRSRTTQRAFVG